VFRGLAGTGVISSCDCWTHIQTVLVKILGYCGLDLSTAGRFIIAD